jgi:hypothetical protein
MARFDPSHPSNSSSKDTASRMSASSLTRVAASTARCGRLPDEAIGRLQIDNLRAARAGLRRHHPHLVVTCYHAAILGEAVTFADVTPAD